MTQLKPMKYILDEEDGYSQGCQAGSMRHKLSGELADVTKVPAFDSPPLKSATVCNRVMMLLTALFTMTTIFSPGI